MRCAQDQVPEIPAVDPEGEERHVDDVNGGVLPKEEVEKARLRCGKSARRCGTKHISKSKCTKHVPFFEVAMSKKCAPLWREAHFEVKMLKTPGVRTTFGGSDVASLRFGSIHYTIHSTTLDYSTLQLQLRNYMPLHSTTPTN